MTLRPALPYPANLCYNGCEVNVMTKTEARAQAKALRKNLDLHAIEWLEQYLSTFKGTVVAISHDRYFLDRTITRVIEVLDGKAEFYSGNYSFYAVEKERRYLQNREILCTFGAPFGKMQEWLNWPAWKASKPLKGFRGSNPLLSAG